MAKIKLIQKLRRKCVALWKHKDGQIESEEIQGPEYDEMLNNRKQSPDRRGKYAGQDWAWVGAYDTIIFDTPDGTFPCDAGFVHDDGFLYVGVDVKGLTRTCKISKDDVRVKINNVKKEVDDFETDEIKIKNGKVTLKDLKDELKNG